MQKPLPIFTRVKAFFLDCFMIYMPINYLVIYAGFGSREGFEANMALGWTYILVPYFCIMFALMRKELLPSMKAYNLKLTCRGKNAKKLLIFVRLIVFIITFFCPILVLVAPLRKDKKYLHDIISQTTLTKK